MNLSGSAPRRPLILLSCRLVVASPLDAPPSRCLVVLLCCPLVVLLCQLVVASSFIGVLSLHRPLVLSLCWLVVVLPFLALPFCPLVAPAIFASPLPCCSPSPMPSNALKRYCRHQMPMPPPSLNTVFIVHRCHSCHPSPRSKANAHRCPLPPSNVDTPHRHPPPLMSICIVALPSPIRSPHSHHCL